MVSYYFLGFRNNHHFLAPWVEEDDIIDEGWESLEITEAGDVVTSGQSSYLSSLWTWATSNPS